MKSANDLAVGLDVVGSRNEKPPLKGVGDVKWEMKVRFVDHRRGMIPTFRKVFLIEKWKIFPKRGSPYADNRAILKTFLKLYNF